MLDALPPAFNGLNNYNQFILYKLFSEVNDNGVSKLIKKPIDYKTGCVTNPLDSNCWADFKTISDMCKLFGSGYGVGFVFTESCPFFLLDIDKCIDPNGREYLPEVDALVKELLMMLSGGAIEISSSGRGLHVIGSTTIPFTHRSKSPISPYLELYTKNRFVALTGTNARGDVNHDLTTALPAVIAKYFPPNKLTTNTNWTTEPREDWNGPEYDAVLIQRALRSVSKLAAFNGRACFADLWECNEDVLAESYPSAESGGYDHSRVDAALAQHLCYWTGCNCERIERLMYESNLARDKWRNRPQYLRDTILRACELQVDVLRDTSLMPQVSVCSEADTTSSAWIEVNIGDIFTNPPQPPKFFIDSLLPAGVLTLLGAHGGTGKSMLALQAAVCLATGKPFMGKVTRQSRVLFFSAEDTVETIRHRLMRICEWMNLAPQALTTSLKIIDATNSPTLYATISGHTATTNGYQLLKSMTDEFRADVIIIDNASDTFDANENERARVREFVRNLVQIGTNQCAAILLLSHIDKQTAKSAGSSEGYSGSTAWHNSARSRLFLTANESDLVLEQQKSNFGKRADPIYLKWTSNAVLEHEVIASKEDAANIVLRLIAKYYAQGEFISPESTSKYNPYKVLSRDLEFPRGIDRKKLADILLQAKNDGRLVHEEYHNAKSRRASIRLNIIGTT